MLVHGCAWEGSWLYDANEDGSYCGLGVCCVIGHSLGYQLNSMVKYLDFVNWYGGNCTLKGFFI